MIAGLVSIIMPSYNTERYIGNSIRSVIQQSYSNWELIIIDDCSTDHTDAVVNQFLSDKRIRYLKNNENSGAAISRNRGLKAARGQWIAFLDSDDLWMPKKLEKQIRFMEEHDYRFTYTNYIEIDEADRKNGVMITGPKRITKQGMFCYCWPGCLTVMYNAKKVGLIQIENIKKNNDYAMWLKVIRKEACYLLDEELAMYRRGRTGSISTHNYATMIRWHYRLFRYGEREHIIASLYHTINNMFYGFIKKIIYTKRSIQ